MISLKEMNEEAAKFWRKQIMLRDRRMADPILREIALNAVRLEMVRGVPTYHQRTLEDHLEEAERNQIAVRRQQARKAGSASKADPLQELIVDIVAHNPQVTADQLLSALHKKVGHGVIDEIIDGGIAFIASDGRSKSAQITGLKDRLSRAKKKIDSR